jgi:hypothetical protein
VQNSGKLLIGAILAVAILLAGAGWWFRYEATNEAARFWGPHAVRLIRDAPGVELARGSQVSTARQPGSSRDVSQAHGLTHLRNALLEDRSFTGTKSIESRSMAPGTLFQGGWSLVFHDPSRGEELTIFFPTDCTAVAFDADDGRRVASTGPIAAGLRRMFSELSPEPPPQG